MRYINLHLTNLTLTLLPYVYSYEASCARSG